MAQKFSYRTQLIIFSMLMIFTLAANSQVIATGEGNFLAQIQKLNQLRINCSEEKITLPDGTIGYNLTLPLEEDITLQQQVDVLAQIVRDPLVNKVTLKRSHFGNSTKNTKQLAIVLSVLKQVQILRHLDLSGNGLNYQDMQILGPVLPRSLETLDLSSNALDEQSLGSITDALEEMPNLSHVNFTKNQWNSGTPVLLALYNRELKKK